MNDKFNFADETQHYHAWVCDVYESAMVLLWERGEHDWREDSLKTHWDAIQPVLEEAFEKAKLYDAARSSKPKANKDEPIELAPPPGTPIVPTMHEDKLRVTHKGRET